MLKDERFEHLSISIIFQISIDHIFSNNHIVKSEQFPLFVVGLIKMLSFSFREKGINNNLSKLCRGMGVVGGALHYSRHLRAPCADLGTRYSLLNSRQYEVCYAYSKIITYLFMKSVIKLYLPGK